ncbi:AIR synthase-related protein [Desulfoglaeba alkanexedens]|uniref:phosphoribosylformylglycinamidine cyclo-ligase n=1 Tax=Desulfoglaeba alkanexedens ALDC TaxID=980445 RepID=A0A4P8L3N5_9BACT|nr:AIR synthase-related protein [Desulfoglaeba alkanexedens]QCQ22567.1 hypothetical protein FDQ92_10565 [Desulfoglaeba alkanexedens ALDC]
MTFQPCPPTSLNIPRILPQTCQAVIRSDSCPVPPIFRFLQEKGNISEEEMFHVFNCGIGYVLVAKEEHSEEVAGRLTGMGYPSYATGEIVARQPGAPQIRMA